MRRDEPEADVHGPCSRQIRQRLGHFRRPDQAEEEKRSGCCNVAVPYLT